MFVNILSLFEDDKPYKYLKKFARITLPTFKLPLYNSSIKFKIVSNLTNITFLTTNLKHKNMYSSRPSLLKRKQKSEKGKRNNEKIDFYPCRPSRNFSKTSPYQQASLQETL